MNHLIVELKARLLKVTAEASGQFGIVVMKLITLRDSADPKETYSSIHVTNAY